MRFIELGSEASYNHKDRMEVSVEIRRQSVKYNELNRPCDYHIGQIIEAGWYNTRNKKYVSTITRIITLSCDFDDEKVWKIYLKRID